MNSLLCPLQTNSLFWGKLWSLCGTLQEQSWCSALGILQRDVFHKCIFFRLLVQPTTAHLLPPPPLYTAFMDMGSAVMVVMTYRSHDQIWMQEELCLQIRTKVFYTIVTMLVSLFFFIRIQTCKYIIII